MSAGSGHAPHRAGQHGAAAGRSDGGCEFREGEEYGIVEKERELAGWMAMAVGERLVPPWCSPFGC